MNEFECKVCQTNVVAIVADAPPADGLCMECRVIQDAAPEDRAGLARVFKMPPVPVAIQRLMDEVRAAQATPAGVFDRAHNRHNRS